VEKWKSGKVEKWKSGKVEEVERAGLGQHAAIRAAFTSPSGSQGDERVTERRSTPPEDHPLRTLRRITDRALERLSARFGTIYIHFGRPSIAPDVHQES
jgi:hypothetical protein